MRPYISTIICTYREKKDHLEAAVDSVLGQKNVKVQLILSTVEGDPAIDFAALTVFCLFFYYLPAGSIEGIF